LDCKEIQPVHSKGDQSWVFFGRNDAKAETPILWPPDAKSWLIGKDPDAGRDWGQKEKGTTEDETAGWHHRLDGHDFGWTPGVGDGQGGLVCCNSWGHKESDMTERLIWLTEEDNVTLKSHLTHFMYIKEVKVKSLSRVRLFVTPWTVARQVPLSMEFSRQEYWSGLPFPSPGDLSDPGIEP